MSEISFEDACTQANDALESMEHRLSRMNKEYRNYIKHGAAKSAAALKEEIESLEQEIECEQNLYRQTFY